jgi:hypothetical protein
VLSIIIAGAGSTITVLASSPESWGSLAIFLFLVCWLSFSVFVLLGFYLRRMFGQPELLNKYFSIAVRQGIFLALILTASLVLASQGLFSWINAMFLVLAVVFFESFLAAKNKIN